MRCLACDSRLTDFESTIKYRGTASGFLDLCGSCRSGLFDDLDTTENYKLFDPDLDVLEGSSVGDENRGSTSDSDDEPRDV